MGHVVVGVPSLFSLVTYNLWLMVKSSTRAIDNLPVPVRERNAIKEFNHHIIKVFRDFAFMELNTSMKVFNS